MHKASLIFFLTNLGKKSAHCTWQNTVTVEYNAHLKHLILHVNYILIKILKIKRMTFKF